MSTTTRRSRGHAYNVTRQAFLAHDVGIADTHWTRLKGLIGTKESSFGAGSALWIKPCQGVHTLAMSFPIDVVYLDSSMRVVHVEKDLRPWTFGRVCLEAETVLELPAHTIWLTGTMVGDQIEIEAERADGAAA